MDVIEVFGKFQLDLLPNDWVSEIWKNQFSDTSELPAEYEMYLESVPIRQLLNESCSSIKQWLASPELNSTNSDTVVPRNRSTDNSSCFSSSSSTFSVDSKSWPTLIVNKVQHKALLCLLSTFIHQGKANPKDENFRQVSLGAVNLYFILLAIPGSRVYNIFNPVLYAQAIESMKVCSYLDPASSKPSKSKRRIRDDSDDSDQSDNENSITCSSKTVLVKSLNVLLNDMFYLLKRFHFKEDTDSLILTIQILVLMTRLEKKVSNFFVVSPGTPSTTSLARNAYVVLKNLCDPEHGDIQETVKLIMRELLPSVLITDQRDTLITAKEASVLKDHSILFIKELLLALKEPAYLGIKILIQHLCVRLPDRAETRAKGVQVVHEVMNVLPPCLYSQAIVWIMKLCHNDEVKNRVTGLEIVTKILFSADKSADYSQFQTSNTTYNEGNSTYMRHSLFSTHKFLLATVFSRCKDVSATVRAKSLSIIANLVSSSNQTVRHEIESIFIHPYEDNESLEGNDVYKKDIFNMHEFLLHFDIEKAIEFDPLPGAKAIFDLLELLADDPKVHVRKSALQVLANIFVLNSKWMSDKRLKVLEVKCRDMSVLVRKMMIQCLTELLERYPTHPNLPVHWVRGVLPLLADQEIKSQEKVLEVLENLVLKNFVQFNLMKKPHHFLPWKLLDLIGELKMHRHFVFACHKWTLNKILKQQTIAIVETHIGTENNNAAWFFLSAVSEYMGIKNPSFVIEYFSQFIHDAPEVDEYCSQLVLEVIFLNIRQFSNREQVNLCATIMTALYSYAVPLPLIARYMNICQFTTENLAEDKETGRERLIEWAGKLMKMSQKYLKRNIGPNSPEQVVDEVLLAQHIFTLGEAMQICPWKEEAESLKLLENLLQNYIEDDEAKEGDDVWKGKVGAMVRAVAVSTLGKMSLQKEKVAKSLVPLFGTLLSHSKEPQIKINTMIALTDLCTKFTSLVEKLIPDMCMCLRDNDLSVKENTLRLFIQLIQEDYLKLRCPLLFHLLSMLLDENQCIRDMVSVFFENSVLSKHKNIMVQHFVEGLFHYNAYKHHPAYSKAVMNFKENEAFSMAGPDYREKRQQIYIYMLENMMDDHRFRTTHNICIDVLGGVTQGKVDLNEQGTAVLKDALHVLCSDEIRMSDFRSKNKDDEDDGEEINVAQVITKMAKKTIISQVVKKEVIENIVPIIIQLKHKLKQMKSPLVKDLMLYLRELMKEYKDEINDILAADKELAEEVLHDLRLTAEESSEEESGDELAKVVNHNEENFQKLMMQAVVHVERLSASLVSEHSQSDSVCPEK